MIFYDEVDHIPLDKFEEAAAAAMRIAGTKLIVASTRGKGESYIDSLLKQRFPDETPVYFSIDGKLFCDACAGTQRSRDLCTHAMELPVWAIDSLLVRGLYRSKEVMQRELQNEQIRSPLITQEEEYALRHLPQYDEETLKKGEYIIVTVDPSNCIDKETSSEFAMLAFVPVLTRLLVSIG